MSRRVRRVSRRNRPVPWIVAAGLVLACAAGAAADDGTAEAARLGVPIRAETEPYAPLRNAFTLDQQLQFFAERAGRDPEDYMSLTQLGQVQHRKARETGDLALYAAAERSLRRAVALNPSYLASEASLAHVLSSQHRFAEAIDLGRKLAAEHPGEPLLLLLVADAELELGDYAGAERDYGEILRRDPRAPLASRRARLAELYGRTAESIRWMERAAREEPRGAANDNAAWYAMCLGELTFKSGRLAEAGRHYNEALDLVPGYEPALVGLAQVRAAEGRVAEAIALYERAAAIAPDVGNLAPLGDLYAASGDRAKAEAAFARIAAEATPGPHHRELSLYYSDHDIELGRALELAEAEVAARKDIYTYDALAWALYKNGRLAEAEQAMAEALRLGTRDAKLFYHSATIHLARGDEAAGRRDLKRALDLNPEFATPEAEAARRRLAGPSAAAGRS